MVTIDQVRRDHAMMRVNLEALASALTRMPGTRFIVQDFCVTLKRQLEAHGRHEHELAQEETRLTPLVMSLLHEHDDALSCLQGIIRLLGTASRESLTCLQSLVTTWVECLREQMTGQESVVLPWLERAWETEPVFWSQGQDSETLVAELI